MLLPNFEDIGVFLKDKYDNSIQVSSCGARLGLEASDGHLILEYFTKEDLSFKVIRVQIRGSFCNWCR